MKEYHPSGVAIDNNGNITQYFLSKVSGNPIRAKVITHPTIVLNPKAFKIYVEENRVQLFQIVDGIPQVSYTDEEVKYLKGKIKGYQLLNNEEYFKSEAVFKNSAYIDESSDKFWLSFAFVCCRNMQMVRTNMIQGVIFLDEYLEKLEVQQFYKMVKSGCVYASPSTTNMCLCNWELNKLQRFLCEVSKYYNISICTKTMLNLNNTMYAKKMLGFSLPKFSEVEAVSEILNQYDTPVYAGSDASGGKIASMNLG